MKILKAEIHFVINYFQTTNTYASPLCKQMSATIRYQFATLVRPTIAKHRRPDQTGPSFLILK